MKSRALSAREVDRYLRIAGRGDLNRTEQAAIVPCSLSAWKRILRSLGVRCREAGRKAEGARRLKRGELTYAVTTGPTGKPEVRMRGPVVDALGVGIGGRVRVRLDGSRVSVERASRASAAAGAR